MRLPTLIQADQFTSPLEVPATRSATVLSGHAKTFPPFLSDDNGYTRAQAFNATHMSIEQISDDQNGKIIDKIWIIKNKHGPYKYKIHSHSSYNHKSQ